MSTVVWAEKRGSAVSERDHLVVRVEITEVKFIPRTSTQRGIQEKPERVTSEVLNLTVRAKDLREATERVSAYLEISGGANIKIEEGNTDG